MNVISQRDNGILYLQLSGREDLDLHCAEDVKHRARALIDGTSDVVIDLSGLRFIDSAGLGVLVSLFKRARGHGRRATFVCDHPVVMEIVSIIQLDRILDFHPDADSAARALAS